MSILNNLNDLFYSIPEVKADNVNQLQLEDMVKIHPMLTLDSPLTYFVFMDRRPDLNKNERNIIFKIIKKLQNNNNTTYEIGSEQMEYIK